MLLYSAYSLIVYDNETIAAQSARLYTNDPINLSSGSIYYLYRL